MGILSKIGKSYNIKKLSKNDSGGTILMDQCIFCKIIKGEIPSATVYEDEDFKAILDISPAAKGHVILLSKKHAENLFDLDQESATKALLVAQKIGLALKEELGFDGMNLLQNNGVEAGQTVFHYHIHLIPRWSGDGVTIDWNHESYKDGESGELANHIRKRIG